MIHSCDVFAAWQKDLVIWPAKQGRCHLKSLHPESLSCTVSQQVCLCSLIAETFLIKPAKQGCCHLKFCLHPKPLKQSILNPKPPTANPDY